MGFMTTCSWWGLPLRCTSCLTTSKGAGSDAFRDGDRSRPGASVMGIADHCQASASTGMRSSGP
eukprot:3436368-Lingulodinium_polyedra.AAC.1